MERILEGLPVLTGESTDKGHLEGSPKHLAAMVDGEEFAWSGPAVLPAVGEVVQVYMNDFGKAEVVGFFISYQFVGFLARPLNPPAWFLKQNAGRWGKAGEGVAWFFGCDLLAPGGVREL